MARLKVRLGNYVNKKGEAPIVFQYNYSRTKRPTVKSDIMVKPKDWNAESNEVRKTNLNHVKLNSAIKALRNELEGWILDSLTQGGLIQPETFKRKFNERLDKLHDDHDKDNDMILWANIWLNQKRPSVSEGTYKSYRIVVNHLTKYAKKRKRTLIVSDLNNQIFYDDFRKYLFYEVEVRGGKQGLKENSVDKHFKSVKTFITFLEDEEKLEKKGRKWIKIKDHETFALALSEAQLQAIEDLEFTGEGAQLMNVVRDTFLIGCETGLRYSDYSRLTSYHIKDGKWIVIQAMKTKRSVTLPISDRVKRILNKYFGDFPPYVGNVELNRHVKEVARLAGLTNDIILTETKAGKTRDEIKKEYELIASHTARRTFATLNYKRNVPTTVLRMITGHKSEKAFLKYIKISEREAAEMLAEYWKR